MNDLAHMMHFPVGCKVGLIGYRDHKNDSEMNMNDLLKTTLLTDVAFN